MSLLRFFRRRAEDAELNEEIDAHIAQEIDDNLARGMSAEEVRRRAPASVTGGIMAPYWRPLDSVVEIN